MIKVTQTVLCHVVEKAVKALKAGKEMKSKGRKRSSS